MICAVAPIDGTSLAAATVLLGRFFRERAFDLSYSSVRANLAALLVGPGNEGLASQDGIAVGIVTTGRISAFQPFVHAAIGSSS